VEVPASATRKRTQIVTVLTPRGHVDVMHQEIRGLRKGSMIGSKGLTVEAAIVVAAEEGVIPRPDADLAEERRLLYVALTRTRRFQFVTWARQRTGPTARAGLPKVLKRRSETRFLRNGPFRTQDGKKYIDGRWGTRAAAA
jgi:hypothetical protein